MDEYERVEAPPAPALLPPPLPPAPPATQPITGGPGSTQQASAQQAPGFSSATAPATTAYSNTAAFANEFQDTDPSALTDFHNTLAPYGTWANDATYGTVWVPSSNVVGSDFAPYVSAGHWALDENNNWLWVSDYDSTFGWAVFHYGRWVWVESRGWVWIPGRRYAPAWVVWRVGEPGYNYIGWAPMPPAFYWYGGTALWLSAYPLAPFVFCPSAYAFQERVNTYIVGRDHIAAVATHSAPFGLPPSGNHVLAVAHQGPTLGSGYVPSSAWQAAARYHVASSPQASFASPHTFASPSTAAGARGLTTSVNAPIQGPIRSTSLGVVQPSPGAPMGGASTVPQGGGGYAPHANYYQPNNTNTPPTGIVPRGTGNGIISPTTNRPPSPPSYASFPVTSAPVTRSAAPAFAAPQSRAPSFSAPAMHPATSSLGAFHSGGIVHIGHR